MKRQCIYPNLECILVSQGISWKEFAALLGISEEALADKLYGSHEFTANEIKTTLLYVKKGFWYVFYEEKH